MSEHLLKKEENPRSPGRPAEGVFAATGVSVDETERGADRRGARRETAGDDAGLEEGLLTGKSESPGECDAGGNSEDARSAIGFFPHGRAILLFTINAFLCQFASFFGQHLTMRLMTDVMGVDPTTLSSRIVLVFVWTLVVFSEFALLRSVLIDVLLSSGGESGGNVKLGRRGGGGGSRRIRVEAEAGIDRAFVLGSLGGCGLILATLQIWMAGPLTAEICIAWAFTLAGLVAFGCFPSMFLRE